MGIFQVRICMDICFRIFEVKVLNYKMCGIAMQASIYSCLRSFGIFWIFADRNISGYTNQLTIFISCTFSSTFKYKYQIQF